MGRLEEIFASIDVEGYPDNLSREARERFERLLQRVAPRPLAATCPTLSLDGEWRVKRWPFGAEEQALAADPAACSAWESVAQPGKVLYQETQIPPSRRPDWNRVTMAHLDEHDGALLVRTVEIPSEWTGKRILWHCDGVYPAGRFYCNGRVVGEHLSGLTAAQYDITSLVEPGASAHLCIRLIRRYKASHIDMPRHSMEFAGLTRHTLLFAVPACYVDEICLPSETTALDRAGSIAGTVSLRNEGTDPVTVAVHLIVTSPDTQRSVEARKVDIDVPGRQRITLPIGVQIHTVELWSDESPLCYRARLKVEQAAGATEYTWRSAFREFTVSGGRPRLNGNPIKLRGVNHVTFSPDGGMYTPVDWLRRCLDLMKLANVNCIRTHYAAQPDLLDMCDEMGFYVLQEIPIDWWGNHCDKPEWLPEVMHRIQGVVARDRHHPCLLGFCLGNENHPTNPDTVDAFTRQYRVYRRFIRALSPGHLVMVPPPGPANRMPGHFEPRFGDIADVHYHIDSIKEFHRTGKARLHRSWQGPVEEFTREQFEAMGWNGVWFSSEYGLFNNLTDLLNGPYLSVITDHAEDWLSGKNSLQTWIDRMEREWGYMRDDPRCLGGAYFPWIAPQAGATFGWNLLGEDADWGVVTPDLMPKPAFWAMRVLFSPVRFPPRVAVEPGQESITVTVTNLFNSIDLSSCTLRTQMEATGRDMGLAREWRDIPVACPPGSSARVELPLWHEGARKSIAEGRVSFIRCHLLKSDGFRVITADILLVPHGVEARTEDTTIAIGSDAEL